MRTFFLLRIPIHVKRWLVLFCVISLFFTVQGQVTLYTYQSGSWNTLDVWTTDPGGTTLVGSRIPENGDVIVVLSSRTLTLPGDISTSGHSLTIQPGAVLDAGSYTFSNPLTLLSGQGIYRLSSPAFPSSSTNDFNIDGGGTVEYYGSSDFNFPPLISNYFHLKVNCSGAVATQINNLTIHGNLTIQSGSFRINDGTSTRRTLIVDGNVEVNTGASITVGNGSTVTTTDPNGTGAGGSAPFLDYYTAQSHRVEISGDLINNGTIRFTNQSHPIYNLFPGDGFASVFFRGGSDNTITCNGTTDFYNLIVDKGSDETFILTINSAGYNKFRLFGANTAANFSSGDVSNPNIRKSLWVRNGTLRLNGYTFIPSLTEGGDDFFIPGKGALVLGSPDVVVMGTIDDYSVVNLAYGVNGGTGAVNGISTVPAIVSSSLSLYGKLQVIEGRLYIGEAGNIVYFGTSSAQFVINGGIIDIKQFQSVSGGGKTAFWQTGGNLILRGRFRRSLQYTSLNDLIVSIGDVTWLNTARASYDGTNPLGTDPEVGTLDIDQDANIFHMEGGDIKIFDVTGSTGTPRAIEINSEPSNVNVTGGNITVYITSGTVLADASYGIASKAPIFNLSIIRNSGAQSGILRAIPAKAGVTANASPPLRVLNNLILSNNSASANDILNTSDFSVITGGNFTIQSNAVYNPGYNRTIMNGTGDQTFTNSGTITSGLHRLVISKTSGSMFMGSNLTVRDSLVIMQGTLNDGGNTLSVGGNVYNGGIHSGTGELVFNGSVRQYITAGGSSLFGNIVLMSIFNTAPYQSLNLNTDISVSSVKLAGNRGVLYLADKGLTVRTQGILLGNSAAIYSSTKMFMTDGSHSAKGINLFLSLTGNLNTNVDTIPVGVYHSGTTAWYTPAIINVNGNLGATVYTGTVNVTPIDYPHPSNKDPNDVLAFYWKTLSTGTIRTINPGFVTFNYYNSFISAPAGSKHYHLEQGSSTWVMGGNYVNPLSFNLGFISGVLTAGKNNPFNGPLICRAVASGFWDQAATWTPRVPLSYDYAVIGGSGATNYIVTIRNSNTISAGVSIWANGIAGDSPKPTLIVNNNLTGVNLTTVAGGGKFILKGHSTVNLPSADFDAFCLNDTAIFEFDDFNSAGGNYTLPGLTVYPNLHITITRQGNYKSLPDADITVRKNLRLYAPTTAHQNRLVLSNSATTRSFTVLGDVEMSSASVIEFPLTAASKILNIYGNINFTYKNTNDANAIRAVSGAGATHVFNFYGDTIITGASLLSFYQAGSTNRINKYYRGTGTVLITEGTGAFSLNNLFIQKDAVTDSVFFRHNFSLNETANNTASKSLTFGKGILVLSDPSNINPTTINLNLSSGGADCLTLNSSSGLILRNGSKINITGNTSGSGIKLDGLLAAEGASEINLADGTEDNTGYIEYSGSGNAYVILNGSSMIKAGQIRRSLLLTTGILNYSQSGTSTSTIYGIGSAGVIDASRARLEVTGPGSTFNMTGTASLTVINGGGTTFGDLYLRPETSDVTGGNIIFGTGVSGQVYKADINIPVNNLTINATGAVNEVQLMVNPLVLTGNLSLTDANSRFTSNSRNVTIGGNLISNGAYDAGTNTTLFNGGTQSITGTTDPSFYKLTISPSVKLVPGLDLTINSDLCILSGTLEAGTHNITVLGNIINNGIYTNDPASASRLYLHGSTLQIISGTGSFGRIELDNSAAGARLGNNLTLTEDLMLTNGVLDINQYSLSLGAESDIITSVFNTGRMIKSDGVFSNGGITKYFSAGYTGTFIYPSGVTGKYTPASLSVSATAAGWVRINVINDKHPATISPFNVLNYYWEAESSISGFDGSLLFKYETADVTGDESSYVAGRLVIPPGTSWSKAASGPSTDNVNEAAHTIFYNYPSGTSNLGGHYTAGYPSDLPNNITVYTSNASGDWNISANWSPAAPAGGPNGQIVVIRAGDVISTNGNKRFAFKTTIGGTLVVGTTYGHNLGTVDGTGTLSMSQANLPAGNFSSFLGCSGGTLEYDGGPYTIVADRIDTVRNLIFKGSGTKILPDKNLVVCNLLEINGPALENYFNRKLSIGGSFILTSGSFLSGSGSGATVTFNGSSPQTVSGFRSANPLNNLEINNASGLTLNSAIMIKGNLMLTNGIINTNADSLLKMTGTTSTATAGNSSSFINGPLSKNQLGGVDFTFPTGKNGRYGSLGLITPQSGVWEAEYYNASYPDVTVAGTLVTASATEYWRIKSPANGKTTIIKLRWDDQSDITPVTTSGGINDIRVAEYDGSDWREKLSAPPTGNDTNGNVQTSANTPVNNSGHPIYYTLGSVSMIKPVIMLGISGSVCRCVTTGYLPYLGTMGSPDQYTIDYNAAANAEGFVDVTAWTAIPASPVSLSLPVSADPGIYNATIRVRSSLNPGNVSIPYAFQVIVLPDISWTGASGPDWNISGNWSCPFLPDLTMPVIIPDVANEPLIAAGWTGTANNLTILPGSSLTVEGTLAVSGTISNGGTFTATLGQIEFNGTGSQVIPADLFSGNRIKNLTISNASGVVLQGPLGVTGIMNIINGEFQSGGNLILVSDNNGTALIDGSGSGNVTGNVTMQRYLSTSFGYKYFSSPFQAAAVSEFANEIDLNNWFPLIYAFDENRYYLTTPLDPFYKYVNPAGILNPLEGYALNFGSDPAALTVDVTGVVNNGFISRTIYNHNHLYAAGRSLVGNPYPSPIDWNAPSGWTKTNIDNALYYFNAGGADEWEGTYSSYINGVSSDGVASNIIASMQGFMVHVSDGAYPVTGTLSMDNQVRVTASNPSFIKGAAKSYEAEKSILRLGASIEDYNSIDDPMVIYFDEKATGEFDSQLDALKYFNTDYTVPSFFSFGQDGSKLSINAIPLPQEPMPAIPLGYKSDSDGEVVFHMLNIEGPYSWKAINFYDAMTGESKDLSSGADYRVYLTAGEYNNRFFLNFDGFATGDGTTRPHDKPFNVFSSNGLVFAEIFVLPGNEGLLSIFSITGQKVYEEKIYTTGRHEMDPGLNDGIYIVSLASGNSRISQKVIINRR